MVENYRFFTLKYLVPRVSSLHLFTATYVYWFIQNAHKQHFVSCLIHHIFNLCFSYENFYTQLDVVTKLFNNFNGFPYHMFDCIVRRFLDHIFDQKPPFLTASKKIIYFCLPFAFLRFKRRLVPSSSTMALWGGTWDGTFCFLFFPNSAPQCH